MIKVNLLNSVTDRAGVAAVVENKVVNPRTQIAIVGAAVLTLMLIVMGFDFVSANTFNNAAKADLEEQKRIEVQLAAIIKEQDDLAKRTRDIQARIDAIQKLRASQRGPVAVLSEVNDRVPSLPNFHLETIEQKGGQLVIKGDSPNDVAVTDFGRSLEFSSGLFTNVSIEIQRKAMDVVEVGGGASDTRSFAKPETVTFTIKCAYTPPQLAKPAPALAGNTAPAAPAAAPVTVNASQSVRP